MDDFIMDMKLPDWQELRKLVPAADLCTFLNTAGRGPISRPAALDGMGYYQKAIEYGNVPWDDWLRRMETIRVKVSELIGAQPKEIAFLPTSSLGMNYAAMILNKPGGVLIPADEFPSCSLPWLRHGYEIDFIPSGPNGVIAPERFQSAITASTKIVVTSHVQYATGFRQDLDKIGEICKERDLIFVVDATQSMGAFPVDVKASNIDFMVFSGYKWLNAGCGIAVLFVSESFLEPDRFPVTGWRSARVPYDLINDRLDISDSAVALELGHPQFPSILALGGAVELISEIGVVNIEKRIQELTEYLLMKLKQMPIEILSPLEPEYRSGITMVSVPDPAAALERLTERRIIVSCRGGALRVSLHYYNTPGDIDTFIDELSRYLNHPGSSQA